MLKTFRGQVGRAPHTGDHHQIRSKGLGHSILLFGSLWNISKGRVPSTLTAETQSNRNEASNSVTPSPAPQRPGTEICPPLKTIGIWFPKFWETPPSTASQPKNQFRTPPRARSRVPSGRPGIFNAPGIFLVLLKNPTAAPEVRSKVSNVRNAYLILETMGGHAGRLRRR
jgi:hypothetical protein